MLDYHQTTNPLPYHILNDSLIIPCLAHSSLNSPFTVHKRIAKCPQAKCRKHAQANGKRLSALDGARDRASGEDDRCQEGELSAVRGAILNAQAAKNVQCADRDASDY
jgi:hypothetical protein